MNDGGAAHDGAKQVGKRNAGSGIAIVDTHNSLHNLSLLTIKGFTPIIQQISQKSMKIIVDNRTPLCYDDFTCEKGLFLCAFFQLRCGFWSNRF
jgi:hypothetical protein